MNILTRWVLLGTTLVAVVGSWAQDAAFSYQGLLQEDGRPASGLFNFQLTLFDAVTKGNALGQTQVENLMLTNGVLTLTLDPGAAALDGNPRWLEIAVRSSGSTNSYTALSPRQALASVPYATRAANFSGSVALSQLPASVARLDGGPQVFTGDVEFRSASNLFNGSFAGSGAGLSNTPPALPGSDLQELVGGSSRNMGRWGLKQTHTKLRSHLPLHILWLGDSIAPGGFPGSQAEQAVMLNALSSLMPRAGSSIVGVGQNYWYHTGNGMGRYAYGPDWRLEHYYMADGTVVTGASSSNGIPATRAELYYFRNSGFGTLLVETNGGSGWGNLATVNADNGGGFIAAFTNWSFPRVPSCLMRVTSSGTNDLLGMGLRDMTPYAGWHESSLARYDTQLTELTATSNTLHTVLSGMAPDLILVSYLDGALMTNGLVALEGIAATACPQADIVYLQPPTSLLDWALLNTITQRLSTEIIGRTYNRPVFDRWLLYMPTNVAAAKGFFAADGVHPTQIGGDYSGAFLLEFLGLSPDFLASYGYTNRLLGSELAGKASLNTGNTFVGKQTIAGNLEVTGYILSQGSTAQLALRDQQATNNQLNLVYERSGIHFRPSVAAYQDQLVSSNINGQIFLDSSTSFNGPPQLGWGNRWDIFARSLSATNLTFAGTPSGVPSNTSAPVKWLRVTNDGALYYLPLYQ